MSLSGVSFIVYFFPLVFVLYYAFLKKRFMQNLILFVASLFFYSWGKPTYLAIIFITIIFNYVMGRIIASRRNANRKYFVIACTGNILILVLCTYSNFIVEVVNSFTGSSLLDSVSFYFPLGVSVYTLLAISYISDVYHERAGVQTNFVNLGLYIAFFPRIFIGPIDTYSKFSEQLKNRTHSFEKVTDGVVRFAEGFVKRVLVASNLWLISDKIFEMSNNSEGVASIPVLLAWLGAVTIALFVYFAVDSYSDMAIGMAKIFGFDIAENMNYPIASRSINEFMSRWHISLIDWFKCYVIKPLSGKADTNKDIMIRNLAIVWVLIGVWYNSSFVGILFGAFIFVVILVEKIFNAEEAKGHVIIRHIYVCITFMISMVILRSKDGTSLVGYLAAMTGVTRNGFYSSYIIMFLREYWFAFVLAFIFIFPVKKSFAARIEKMKAKNQTDDKKANVIYNAGHIIYYLLLAVLTFIAFVVIVKGGSYNMSNFTFY